MEHSENKQDDNMQKEIPAKKHERSTELLNVVATEDLRTFQGSKEQIQKLDSDEHRETNNNYGGKEDSAIANNSLYIENIRKTASEKFEYFFEPTNVFSQFHPSVFYVDEQRYICAEQFMMYKKAVLFEDHASAKKILNTKMPLKMQSLGRAIRNLDHDVWKLQCLHVVKQGNIAKFSQNLYLRDMLFSTYPKLLVEASYDDMRWGIGLLQNDPKAWDKKTWRGTNWLGYILTEVRDELMCDKKIITKDLCKKYLDKLLYPTIKHPDLPADSK